MKLERIDKGREFDWGRTSEDYAKYRDIYPDEFYQKLLELGLCVKGQKVLDLGTGTGVLPRSMCRHGAAFTGTDLSAQQIEAAKKLTQEMGMEISYQVIPAEEIDFPENTFDVVTACQCFFYFDQEKLLPKLSRMLKPGGRLAVLYMAWLPYEDPIAGASEELVLKYNPQWSGAGETRHPLAAPEESELFELEHAEIFDLKVPFTRESWNGRMKACRGIGASLPEEKIQAFETEHLKLLSKIAPETFEVLHYAAFRIMRVKG